MSQERIDEIGRTAAKILLDTKSVLFNAKEPFVLTSGRTSPVYIDCRRLISFPDARDELMSYAVEILSEEIGEENLDYIAGGETAGIPYSAFISDRMHKPLFVDVLRQAGATVEHAFVVFHYGIFERSKTNMEKLGITLHELTNWWYVLDVAREENYFDADTLASVEDFLKNPDIWSDMNSKDKTGENYAI